MGKVTLEELDNFVTSINEARNLNDVLKSLEKKLYEFGFENFSYWLNWPPIDHGRQLFISNYPSEFLQHYVDNDYRSCDLVGTYSAQTNTPFLWQDVKKRFLFTKDQRAVFDDSYSAGVKTGASVPIFGPNNMRATFSVANDTNDTEFEKMFLQYRHIIHLMSSYAHEKINSFNLEKPVNDIILTARETEVLTWIARGKTFWEIGRILCISENTIKRHMQHACYKLGVTNKTHAVAVAIINGLINP